MTAITDGGLLDLIDSPADLRQLSPDLLPALACELRAAVIDTVLSNGGHLGSNLGAVELTIALHRVFESPTDAILFDTGHQCYPHKLLTGRTADWDSLRKPGGLSGYPNRTESAHDWIENSHASTVLAYAHGLAVAAQNPAVPTRARRVVAVIGDGAFTGGMAYEGLNNIGHSGADCIIVLNDNGRSYAPTVTPFAGERGSTRKFVESLGIAYSGPIDGHDIEAMEAVLLMATLAPGPQLVHVITGKGKGYEPAEGDAVKKMHDTSSMDPASFTATFAKTLVDLGELHPQLTAITAAMPDSTGLLPFAQRFPERFLDVGIAEQHAVTAAAGMAMGGLIPVVAIYSTFLTRAIDQVTYDVGLHNLPVIFCIDRAGITGDDGASHNGVLDMMLLAKVPGITLLAPSSCDELEAMLHEAVAIVTGPNPGPVAIRWSKVVPPITTVGVAHGTAARRHRQGRDVCIVAAGHLLHGALAAASMLEEEGISATVWDPRRIQPLDGRLLRDAGHHRVVLTVEDGIVEGGMGSAIAQRLANAAIGERRPPLVVNLGTPVRFLAHGKPTAILAALGLDAEGIASHVRRVVHGPPPDVIDLTDRTEIRGIASAAPSVSGDQGSLDPVRLVAVGG